MDKKTVFFLGLSLVILAVMLYFIGIDQVIEALKIAKLEFIALAIAMQVFTYYLYTLRWKILNNVAGIDAGVKNLLPMVLVGLAVNNITPSGRGGGEPVRAYILSREKNYPMEETFATVVADRALDTFPFVLLCCFDLFAGDRETHRDLTILRSPVSRVDLSEADHRIIPVDPPQPVILHRPVEDLQDTFSGEVR